MTDILNYIGTWSVLKWVLLVLIAGFIGQFGRMMAEAIMVRVRRRRAKQHPLLDDARPPQAASVSPVDVPQIESPRKPAAVIEMPDKKALKIMAKVRKKEVKKN